MRRQVTAEIARVLKPGGLFVFLDSLQMGDKPGWDGLLESFPHRFHEPYYRSYAIDDLEGMFAAAACAGLDVDAVPVEADGAAQARVTVGTPPFRPAKTSNPVRSLSKQAGARGPPFDRLRARSGLD